MFVVGGISFKASLVVVPNITHEILRTVPVSCSECMCAYLIAGAIVGGVVGVVLIMDYISHYYHHHSCVSDETEC